MTGHICNAPTPSNFMHIAQRSLDIGVRPWVVRYRMPACSVSAKELLADITSRLPTLCRTYPLLEASLAADGQSWQATSTLSIWHESFPFVHDDVRAAALFARHSQRSIRTQYAPTLTVQLFSFADDVHELHLSTHAMVLGRCGLDHIASYLLGQTVQLKHAQKAPLITTASIETATRHTVSLDWSWSAGNLLKQPQSNCLRVKLPISVNEVTAEQLTASLVHELGGRCKQKEIVVTLQLSATGATDVALPGLDSYHRLRFALPDTNSMQRLWQLSGDFAAALAASEQVEVLSAVDEVQLQMPSSARSELCVEQWTPSICLAKLQLVLCRGAGCDELALHYRADQIASEAAQSLLDSLLQSLHVLRGEGAPTLANPSQLSERLTLAAAGIGLTKFSEHVDHGCSLFSLVAARCNAIPDAPAIGGKSGQISYRELQCRAAAVSRELKASGIGAGQLVGICMQRDVGCIVAMLGVLGSGAGYVPLDPAYPDERLLFMVNDAGLSLVLVQDERNVFAEADTLLLDGSGVLLKATSKVELSPLCTPSSTDLAYVIYTSGSSGKPKGVMVENRNVVALLQSTIHEFGFTQLDTWTCFHSFSFDFSVWEIWACLATGGRLLLVEQDVARAPNEFLQLLAKENVTVLNQTPSAFTQLLLATDFASTNLHLRLVIFGGEPLRARSLLRWFDRYPEDRCRLVNMYGITETTVHCTWKTMQRKDALSDDRSVGVAIPGWRIEILSEDGRRCPQGVAGEIWVAGPGLARGYIRRAGMSANRFRPDHTQSQPGKRLYKSGDKGRLRWDGQIEHLGRLDQQVKVRGYRIELGEIRSHLLQSPNVKDAAVVVAARGASEDLFVDAYVVGAQTDLMELRKRLQTALPSYMVPATITLLDALPLTINGKLDHKSLRPLSAAYQSPMAIPIEQDRQQKLPPSSLSADGSLQQTVASVWLQVLGIQVGPDDNFFLVGGNSLLAIRIAKQLQDRLRQQVENKSLATMTARHLYANPTIRGLSAALQTI